MGLRLRATVVDGDHADVRALREGRADCLAQVRGLAVGREDHSRADRHAGKPSSTCSSRHSAAARRSAVVAAPRRSSGRPGLSRRTRADSIVTPAEAAGVSAADSSGVATAPRVGVWGRQAESHGRQLGRAGSRSTAPELPPWPAACQHTRSPSSRAGSSRASSASRSRRVRRRPRRLHPEPAARQHRVGDRVGPVPEHRVAPVVVKGQQPDAGDVGEVMQAPRPWRRRRRGSSSTRSVASRSRP